MNSTNPAAPAPADAADAAKQRLKMLRAVAIQADRDEVRGKAETFGQKAAEGLKSSKRAQVTGLENAANSALKVSDVFDYIKLRTARHSEWRQENWGSDLLEYMSGSGDQKNPAPLSNLRLIRDYICGDLKIAKDSAAAQEVYLLLIREFTRQFSAEYEYRCKRQELSNKQP